MYISRECAVWAATIVPSEGHRGGIEPADLQRTSSSVVAGSITMSEPFAPHHEDSRPSAVTVLADRCERVDQGDAGRCSGVVGSSGWEGFRCGRERERRR
jgi:hypothetical protein